VTKGYRLLDVKTTNFLLVEMSFLMKNNIWEDKKIENTAIISSNQEEDEKVKMFLGSNPHTHT